MPSCHITLFHITFLHLKIILKILGKISQLAGMSYHLMPHHFSLLKNNSKNTRKFFLNKHGTSPFSIEK
jgi:hypothetical protein